jgi:branched-chain amino acid transport system ATP-binding protein
MVEKSLSILEVNNITRRFGGLIAVDRVSFQVNQGEIFGLIGPNGAGKTTLFNLITGLIDPTSGELIHSGKHLVKLQPHQIARRGIARTFQNLRLFDNLSVLENVAIARQIHCRGSMLGGVLGVGRSRSEEKYTFIKAKELLDLLGLLDRGEQQAKTLAYGDRRRLEIARALALEPNVLLLDEPAAGMNPNEKAALSKLIGEIRSTFNLTIILIEHHVPLVMGLCDRIAVLNFGKLIALGEPQIVKNDPVVIKAYLGE